MADKRYAIQLCRFRLKNSFQAMEKNNTKLSDTILKFANAGIERISLPSYRLRMRIIKLSSNVVAVKASDNVDIQSSFEGENKKKTEKIPLAGERKEKRRKFNRKTDFLGFSIGIQ